MPARVTLRGIEKTFAFGSSQTRAVRGVDLNIEPGEMFFLLGPSGCGKTTIMRMIAGFIDPTAGSIHFDDRDVTRLAANKRDAGMVFQSYALWPHMTVEANVAFGLDIRKVPADERRRRIDEALASVRMTEYSKHKPNMLSGGQQQRVALARALVVRPSVLLLDEPLSNLDARLRVELRQLIRTVCKEAGMTTIYVTHDQEEALSMADRIAVIRDGQIVQIGSPTQIYDNPSSVFVAQFLGDVNLAGATVRRFHVEHAELEVGQTVVKSRRPAGVSEGAAVTLAVRPENVTIAPANHAEARAALQATASREGSGDRPDLTQCLATVRSITFLGDSYTVLVGINDQWELSARLHHSRGRAMPEIGSTVAVWMDPGAVMVYPA